MTFRPLASLASLALLTVVPATLQGAEDTQRLCDLQGRELALRATETLLPDLDRSERQALAELATTACLDYAELWTNTDIPTNAPDSSGTDQTADSNGLFEDIRVIDPQDRVRRPGLKRP